MSTNVTHDRMIRRKRRVSSNIKGTDVCPRVVVYRSNTAIYAQAIDDVRGVTIGAYSTVQMKKDKTPAKGTKSEVAKIVGKKLGELLKSKNISHVVFDRSRYAYLGRVKELADGIRAVGLQV